MVNYKKCGLALRNILLSLPVAASVYAAGVFTSEQVQEALFHALHRGAVVETGYYPDFRLLHKKQVVNPNGSIENYLVDYAGVYHPVLLHNNHLQVDTIENLISNTTVDELALAVDSSYSPKECWAITKRLCKSQLKHSMNNLGYSIGNFLLNMAGDDQ